MAQATVRLQSLDGGWETVGKDRLRGIDPEGLTLSANAWGSDTCRFTLRRDPKAAYPDLGAFTPCEVEVAGQVVWSGRVWETPTKEGTDSGISVEGRGWQYHLDDDVYTRMFVHTTLSDFKDLRSWPTAELGAGRAFAGGTVSTDGGALTMVFPNGVTAGAGAYVGVALDLGPNQTWISGSLDYETSNNSGSILVYVRGHSAPDSRTWTINDLVSGSPTTTLGASGTTSGTITTASRYVLVFLYWSAGGVPGGDVWLKVKGLRLFSSDVYRSGASSVLKASQVAADALAVAPLLSRDTSRISTTTFSVPEFFFTDPKTPREAVTAVNAYHNYRTRVDTDAVLRFDPYPSVPKYEAGPWQGVEFEDASANSGESIYNRALVQATGPDGEQLIISRSALEAGAAYRTSTSPAPTNGAFDTNTTGWTTNLGTITRSAGAVGQWTPTNNTTAVLKGTMTGTFKAGTAYRIRFEGSVTAGGPTGWSYRFGDVPNGDFVYTPAAGLVFSTTNTYELTWTPKFDSNGVTLEIYQTSWAGTFNIDNVRVEVGASLVDRRGFTRTIIFPVESALTVTSGQQIADVFLLNHQTTPLRGGATVNQGGLREPGSSTTIHPALLLANAGELIRFTDRIDPDTGAVGRDGRIASVSYNHDQQQAAVAIDNERRNFEALLSRLAAFSR